MCSMNACGMRDGLSLDMLALIQCNLAFQLSTNILIERREVNRFGLLDKYAWLSALHCSVYSDSAKYTLFHLYFLLFQ